MKEPIIVGEKVSLRPLEKGDVKLISKWHNDEEIMTLFALTKETTEEYWYEWLKKVSDHPNIIYLGIVKNADDRFIGYVHLEQIYWQHRLCRDIGILIGEKDEWSKGFGTEAMRLLIRYAFEELGLHRLELMTFDFNERGLRVWNKLGFRREGVMRKARLARGEWHDVIFMALLEDEFENKKE